jgi:hypothetical protein
MRRLCRHGLVLSLVVAVAVMVAARLMGWWGAHAGFHLLIPEELAHYHGGPRDLGLYLALLGASMMCPLAAGTTSPGPTIVASQVLAKLLTPFPPSRAVAAGRCSFIRLFVSFPPPPRLPTAAGITQPPAPSLAAPRLLNPLCSHRA